MSELRNRSIAFFKTYQPKFSLVFLTPRYWPWWFGFAVLWLMSLLPQSWRAFLAKRIGWAIYRHHRKRREIVEVNLAWCFPEMDEEQRQAIGESYFRYLVQSILDTGVLWWRSNKTVVQYVELRGEEYLQSELDKGNRVIIVTGHSPGLEKGGVALSAHYPMSSFTNEAKNPLLEWMAVRKRTRFGGYVFPRSGGFRPVIKAIRQGYGLYILADEDLGPESATFIPFFGIPRATLTTPLRLARTSRAVIISSFTWYDESCSRYVMEFFPVLDGLDTVSDEEALTMLNQRLEQVIRRHPEQYMWSLRLFKTMQDGSPPPYYKKNRPGSGPRPRPE